MRKPCFCQPLFLSLAILLQAAFADRAFAVNEVPYPEVKVATARPFQTDSAFKAMRKRFSAAVANKNAKALYRLVGPAFIWTFQGALSAEFDFGLNATENFKIAFGFRAPPGNRAASAAVRPYWGALEAFAAESTFYKVPETENMVCGPTVAGAADPLLFELVNEKVQSGDDPVIWYFTLAETMVTARPEANATSVSKVGRVALPLLDVHPPQQGNAPVEATHLEVLLPSGRSGWVPLSAVRPMASNRLCYAKTPKGEWKIVYFDQNEE